MKSFLKITGFCLLLVAMWIGGMRWEHAYWIDLTGLESINELRDPINRCEAATKERCMLMGQVIPRSIWNAMSGKGDSL